MLLYLSLFYEVYDDDDTKGYLDSTAVKQTQALGVDPNVSSEARGALNLAAVFDLRDQQSFIYSLLNGRPRRRNVRCLF
jgi:hypothetical protein